MHLRHVATLAVLLWASSALAGPPAPRVWIEGPGEVFAANEPVLFTIRGNCVALLPKGPPEKAMTVTRDGNPVAGSWVHDPNVIAWGQHVRRLRFQPKARLTPGTYQVKPVNLGPYEQFRRKQWSFEVGAGNAPLKTFGGMAGASCIPNHHYEGCDDGQGITLQPKQPFGLGKQAMRSVVYLRERGKPYSKTWRWETDRFRLNWLKAILKLAPGRYIVTQRAVGPTGTEVGTPCEVELTLPTTNCDQFPKPKGSTSSGRGYPAAHGRAGGLIKAKCAKRLGDSKGVHAYRSAIDKTLLRFAP